MEGWIDNGVVVLGGGGVWVHGVGRWVWLTGYGGVGREWGWWIGLGSDG